MFFVLAYLFSNREKKRQVQSWMCEEIGRIRKEMKEGKLIRLYCLKKMFLILKIEHASKLERMGFLVWGDSLVERMQAIQH